MTDKAKPEAMWIREPTEHDDNVIELRRVPDGGRLFVEGVDDTAQALAEDVLRAMNPRPSSGAEALTAERMEEIRLRADELRRLPWDWLPEKERAALEQLSAEDVPDLLSALEEAPTLEAVRWQKRLHAMRGVCDQDASGNESGDPLDYTADCIRMAMDELREDVDVAIKREEELAANLEDALAGREFAEALAAFRLEELRRARTEQQRLAEECQRVKAACDIFEANSADATAAWEQNRALAARVAELERALDSSRADYSRALESRDNAERDSDEYAARMAELEGALDKFAVSIGYGDRPEGRGGVIRPELDELAGLIGQERESHQEAEDLHALAVELLAPWTRDPEEGFTILDALESAVGEAVARRPDARLCELARRMVAPGPAFALLSASEGHEIADWILRAPAAPVKAPDMLASLAYVWRCSGCGEMLDNPPSPSWRWTGTRWEHRCPESDPQAGYEPARSFGRRDQPVKAPPPADATEHDRALEEAPMEPLGKCATCKHARGRRCAMVPKWGTGAAACTAYEQGAPLDPAPLPRGAPDVRPDFLDRLETAAREHGHGADCERFEECDQRHEGADVRCYHGDEECPECGCLKGVIESLVAEERAQTAPLPGSSLDAAVRRVVANLTPWEDNRFWTSLVERVRATGNLAHAGYGGNVKANLDILRSALASERARGEATPEVKRLRELLTTVAEIAHSMPHGGHEGDEESGQCDPDCSRCLLDALEACVEDALGPAPLPAQPAEGATGGEPGMPLGVPVAPMTVGAGVAPFTLGTTIHAGPAAARWLETSAETLLDGQVSRTCATCAQYSARLMVVSGESDGVCGKSSGIPTYANADDPGCSQWSLKEERPLSAVAPNSQPPISASQTDSSSAVAPDPLCARDLGPTMGGVCGHLLSEHSNGGRCVGSHGGPRFPGTDQDPSDCTCPGFVPPAGTEGGEKP